MDIPFNFEWCKKKCTNYICNLKLKGKKYKAIRTDIQKQLKFGCFKLPLNNIVVLKNYYTKNCIVISIQPFFTNKKMIIVKKKNDNSPLCDINYYDIDKNVNVYEHFMHLKSGKCQ